MQIIVNEEEIKQLVKEYVARQVGRVLHVTEVSINWCQKEGTNESDPDAYETWAMCEMQPIPLPLDRLASAVMKE